MLRFPHYLQRNVMDCGATCLRIIGRHYGRVLSLEHLRKVTYTDRSGASLLGLSKGAEAIGLRSLAVKISFNRLRQDAPLPLIAHWNQNHFVVVYKITGRHVFISDPGKGLLKYPHQEFLRHWIDNNSSPDTESGIALLLEPTPKFYESEEADANEGKIDVRSFLLHYMRPHRRLFVQVLLSLMAASALQLMVPFLTQNIVDTGIYKKDIPFIWLVLAAQLALTVGQMTLELLRSWMLVHISSRINISLVSDFFVKLMRLPIRYFDTRLTGDLMQRIGDHQRIESFLTGTTLSTLFSVFTLLLYGLVLASYSLVLFGIFLAGSALYVGWVLIFMKRREKLNYKHFQLAGATNTKVIEMINGMQEIKLHNAEQQQRWGWERLQVRLFHVSLKNLGLEQWQSAGARILNEGKNLLLTVTAALLVIEGKMTLGAMLAVSYILGQLNGPVAQLIGSIKSWQDARIAMDRLLEIHQKEEEDVPGAYSHHSTAAQQDIVLENVSFRYDALSDDVLQDLSLSIEAGKVTAIVGSSGSGKTTLLKLLMRFYEPTAGQVLLGSKKLSGMDVHEWRQRCGVVMQEGFIFNDTIAANIAVGMEDPDWERLEEAARLANILPFIETLPLGLQTKIGQEGLGISTGQKQRMLIARAIYKNPDILLFDEATSALDANNERIIMKNLENFYRGKTVVVIAHRLSTVKHADKIVVLEKGKIVEEGNHALLSQSGGNYYELVKNQLELGA